MRDPLCVLIPVIEALASTTGLRLMLLLPCDALVLAPGHHLRQPHAKATKCQLASRSEGAGVTVAICCLGNVLVGCMPQRRGSGL